MIFVYFAVHQFNLFLHSLRDKFSTFILQYLENFGVKIVFLHLEQISSKSVLHDPSCAKEGKHLRPMRQD